MTEAAGWLNARTAIKVKLRDAKVWYFVTPNGGITRLRVHASLNTPERAAELVAIITSGKYPEVEAAKAITF